MRLIISAFAFILTLSVSTQSFSADTSKDNSSSDISSSDITSSGITSSSNTLDAKQIVKAALDQWRGLSSYSEMTMIIHRPDWERKMVMRGWTQGAKKSLVRVIEPVKDVGSGTLLLNNQMWMYTPKTNSVIKVPGSMMNQSWMGSDFSNNDVARSDDILEEYTHSLIEVTAAGDFKAYVIEAIPHDDAPVVWGREVLTVREDYVLLEHKLYDQDNVLVKTMSTFEIKTFDGRQVAAVQRMVNQEKPEEWTELQVNAAEFDIEISPRVFTQSNLSNPRE